MSTEPAYYTYSKQLASRGFGYPLWHPEPSRGHEIQIGDVGYLLQGSFWHIFNATLPEDHPSNQVFGVPDDYNPFKIAGHLKAEQKHVIDSALLSSSVKTVEVGGGGGTSLVPVGASMKFECNQEQGAFVVVDQPADRVQMHPSKSFIPYMKANVEHWSVLASNHDLSLARESLMFVSGTVKTNDWGLGAFISNGQSCVAEFQAQVPFAQASLTWKTSHQNVGNTEVRRRPKDDAELQYARELPAIESRDSVGSSRRSMDSVHSLHQKKDQTVFFHYYKMKKRLWFMFVKAAAGPHELDHDSSGEGGDTSLTSTLSEDGEVVEDSYIAPMYDPVDYLLDYILKYPVEDGTEVQVAIASDTHLYALFDGELPSDIPAALDKLRPPILFVDDEREVAAIAVAEWSEEFTAEGGMVDGREIRDTGKRKEDFQASDGENCEAPDGESDPSRTEEDKDLRPAPVTAYAQIGQPIVLQEHTGGVTCVAFSPDGRYVASGSEDTVIIIRNAANGHVFQKITEHVEAIWTLAFSPDSKRLASGANDGNALIWDLEQSAVVVVMEGHSGVVQTIAYSPDGSKLVTSSVDFSVRIWDAMTGALLHSMGDHRAVVITAVFSPDGRWVASCGADYKAKIWNVDTGTLHRTLAEHTGVVWSIAFSPDSRKVVTGSDDTTSRIWNADTGEELVAMHEHSGPVWSVAFSSNGKHVMSASNDATIKICNALTGEGVHAFDRHDTLVNAAVFSPDGKYVASSAGDNAVMVWNLENGRHFMPMEGHLDKVTGLQFSPEGDRVVSCSDDGTVRIWTLPEVEQLEHA